MCCNCPAASMVLKHIYSSQSYRELLLCFVIVWRILSYCLTANNQYFYKFFDKLKSKMFRTFKHAELIHIKKSSAAISHPNKIYQSYTLYRSLDFLGMCGSNIWVQFFLSSIVSATMRSISALFPYIFSNSICLPLWPKWKLKFQQT